MQDESWHQLVETVWPEKADTVEFLRNEKRRTEIITTANTQARGRR